MDAVTDLEGNYIFSEDGEQVLVKLKNEDKLTYVKADFLNTETTLPDAEEECGELTNANELLLTTAVTNSSENECNRNWSRSEILNLISLYERHRDHFRSTTMKNEKVWKMISEKIKTHSPCQCENKFKYLKSRYIKKIENMGAKKTGEAPIKFEYFSELDAIFGKDHNIKPLAIASTIAGCSSQLKDELENPIKEKKRKIESKETSRQQRHNESMKIKREALDTFKEYMDKLLEK